MKIFALITALAAVAFAAPAKRDMVIVTEMQTVTATVTVDATVVVWVDGATVTSTEIATTSSPAASVQKKNKSENKEPAQLTTYVQPTTSTPVPTTSSPSVYVAPAPTTPSTTAPTTTSAAAPTTPTTTYVAPSPSAYSAPTTSSAAAPAYSAPASSGGDSGCDSYSAGASCSGVKFSYYTPGMGACGVEDTESSMIAAFPSALFSALTPNGNPNNNPLCGKKISITAYDGSEVVVKVVDSCPGCTNLQLDLSPAAWDAVSKGDPNADGICSGYDWKWM